jgi:hypothetical protein
MALRTIGNRIGSVRQRLHPPPKQVDDHYSTAAHKTWARDVLRRAGFRCQYVERGLRCEKSAPDHRLFADHLVEVKDNPALALDPNNGQCLCGSHHTLVTAQRRAERNRS